MTPVLDDRIANALCECVECFVPGRAFPFSFAAFACTFEWIKNAIWIGYLVQRCRAFRAVASTRARVFGVAFKLLNVARDFIDISEQATCRFAVEARGRDDRVMALFAFRPRARIELGPVVPALLRRKRGEMTAARAWVESLFHLLCEWH